MLAGKHIGPDGKPAKVTQATIYEWVDAYENHGGLEALKPKIRDDKGEKRNTLSREFDRHCPFPEEQKQAFVEAITLYIRSQWASGVSGRRDLMIFAESHLRAEAQRLGWTPPQGVEFIGQRYVESQRRFSLVARKEKDAKGWFDHHLPRVIRTAAYLKPMELVVADVHPLDIGLDLPDGTKPDGSPKYRRVYPRLIAWHDVATGRLYVSMIFLQKREGVRREHIAQSFSNMVEQWGLPERLYLDNGNEYFGPMLKSFVDLAQLTRRVRAEFLAAAGEEDRAMVADARAEIAAPHDPEGHLSDHEIHRARPYNAPAKPIEGLFSVLEGTVFKMLQGWVGGDRVKKKTQNVGQEPDPYPGTPSDLFRAVETALAYYHRKAQLGWLDGKSPVEMYAQHIKEGWQRIECEPKTLRLGFAEDYTPKADRGTVTVNGVRYYHDELLPYTGQKLAVKVARHDPRHAFVFNPADSKLICAAEPDRPYDYRDPRGAEEAGRRVKWLNRHVAEMGECCDRLDLEAEMEKVRQQTAMPVAATGATVEMGEQAAAMQAALEKIQEGKARERAGLPRKAGPRQGNSVWSADEEEDPLTKGLVFLPDDETTGENP